jgi:hypothetical protein
MAAYFAPTSHKSTGSQPNTASAMQIAGATGGLIPALPRLADAQADPLNGRRNQHQRAHHSHHPGGPAGHRPRPCQQSRGSASEQSSLTGSSCPPTSSRPSAGPRQPAPRPRASGVSAPARRAPTGQSASGNVTGPVAVPSEQGPSCPPPGRQPLTPGPGSPPFHLGRGCPFPDRNPVHAMEPGGEPERNSARRQRPQYAAEALAGTGASVRDRKRDGRRATSLPVAARHKHTLVRPRGH